MVETFQTKMQARQADHALHIAEINSQVAKLGEDDEPVNTNVIGFQTTPQNLFEEEEDDDYDDV